jgi:hypothetical protein
MTKRKLFLRKITIQNLDVLDSYELKVIKGGDDNENLTTVTPVYCPPQTYSGG